MRQKFNIMQIEIFLMFLCAIVIVLSPGIIVEYIWGKSIAVQDIDKDYIFIFITSGGIITAFISGYILMNYKQSKYPSGIILSKLAENSSKKWSKHQIKKQEQREKREVISGLLLLCGFFFIFLSIVTSLYIIIILICISGILLLESFLIIFRNIKTEDTVNEYD